MKAYLFTLKTLNDFAGQSGSAAWFLWNMSWHVAMGKRWRRSWERVLMKCWAGECTCVSPKWGQIMLSGVSRWVPHQSRSSNQFVCFLSQLHLAVCHTLNTSKRTDNILIKQLVFKKHQETRNNYCRRLRSYNMFGRGKLQVRWRDAIKNLPDSI